MVIDASIDEKDKSRLRILIISRLAIITLFLGAAIFIDIIKPSFSVPSKILNSLYVLIAITYICSAFYVFLIRIYKNLRLNINIQLTVDVILITALVYITGSLQTNYSLLYTLVIIYSVIFLGRRGGLITASASGILYGLLLDLEFYKVIPSMSITEHDYNLTAADVFVRILVHIVSFYILAFLASFVVEQEKKTR
jgi:two-component system sensor histidine kinase PilS (NtrC family)